MVVSRVENKLSTKKHALWITNKIFYLKEKYGEYVITGFATSYTNIVNAKIPNCKIY